jgi:hypothetical protein
MNLRLKKLQKRKADELEEMFSEARRRADMWEAMNAITLRSKHKTFAEHEAHNSYTSIDMDISSMYNDLAEEFYKRTSND